MSQVCVILVDRENKISFVETSAGNGIKSEDAAVAASKQVGREGFIDRLSIYHFPSGEELEIFLMDVRQIDETKTVKQGLFEDLLNAVNANKVKDIILATAIRDLAYRNSNG